MTKKHSKNENRTKDKIQQVLFSSLSRRFIDLFQIRPGTTNNHFACPKTSVDYTSNIKTATAD